jgi:hypothetical protein
MRQLLCRVVVALCSTALVACTSLRTVHDAGAARSLPDASAAPLAAGDEVTVSMTDAFIEGTQLNSNQAEHIELAEVANIERREFSGIKTVVLVLATYAVLYAIAVAAGTAALASNI